jgi:hypothetical protein
MRRARNMMIDDAPRRSRSNVRRICVILVGLALSPLVYEASAICAAQWRTMWGASVTVETPVLDAFGRYGRSVALETRRKLETSVRDHHWRPALVIPLACAWAGLASMLLRRR